MDISVNLLWVLVATVAGVAIGMAWYSPKLFGNQWMKLSGITPDPADKKGMYQGIAIGFAANFFRAYILAHFVYIVASMDWMEALVLAFWLWLGFVATTLSNIVAWEGKSWKLFALHGAYHFVSLAAMAIILTYFA